MAATEININLQNWYSK